MTPISYIVSFFRSPKPPVGERGACDFDLVGRYFYNNSQEERAFETIDAETASDLDLNAVFERIDRTVSKVGQQVLYARLRTLRGRDDTEEFGRRTDWFGQEAETAERCKRHLARLAEPDAYDLQNLVFDTPARVRHIGWIYALSGASVASLLAGICIHPLFLLPFVAVFACNLCFHLGNKLNITLYASAVRQLARALKTGRALAAEGIPGADGVQASIRQVALVERRSRIVSRQGDGGNELAVLFYLFFELVKIAFNIETILFHLFMDGILSRREAIRSLLRFIGETDAAISVRRLRAERATCRPTFTDGKALHAVQVVHPLIERCVENTLHLKSKGLLLTGSNMSGKTTFIRTLMLNALLAETLDLCFAEAWTAPYLRLFSAIRTTDDVSEGTSYYLQEVKTIKRQLDEAAGSAPCLFALDELFKGTNTTERIAAGKAVLARLNRGPHLVLCATHDVELAELLRNDGYELYHFREQVQERRLVFDYRLHAGPLTTRNAIRILELYDYPPELIDEAIETQQRLLAQKERA